MGFFDRLVGKKPSGPAPAVSAPAAKPAPAPAVSHESAAPEPAAESPAPAGGGVMPQLLAAREKLEARDLPGALAIYEQVLAAAGDRPDVLVTISGDLGSCGFVEPIVELIAPRYDAERHGPATGLNLLQAYLAVRNPDAAQHLLDILFGLNRPELEERLWGFSNAIAELIEAQRTGAAAPPAQMLAKDGAPGDAARAASTIHLVSISKPIWSYGVDALPGLLPPKEGGRLRRVAFAQLATLGVPDLRERMAKPEDELGRFARGFPLWLAETLYLSPHYAPMAAVGMVEKAHYALFPGEWTTDNIRQLVDTSGSGLDYVFTGAIREQNGDTELVLRLWEIKKFRERKVFNVRWTPATADAELAKLHEQLRLFMEWSAYPAGAGVAYTPPPRPTAWIHTLGASLSLFLADKGVLPKEQAALPPAIIDALAEQAVTSEAASLAWLTLGDRARRLGLAASMPAVQLHPGATVQQVKSLLDR